MQASKRADIRYRTVLFNVTPDALGNTIALVRRRKDLECGQQLLQSAYSVQVQQLAILEPALEVWKFLRLRYQDEDQAAGHDERCSGKPEKLAPAFDWFRSLCNFEFQRETAVPGFGYCHRRPLELRFAYL